MRVRLALSPVERREVEALEQLWNLEHAVVTRRLRVRVEDLVGQARLVLSPQDVLSWEDHLAIARLACAYTRGDAVPPIAVSPTGRGHTLRDGNHRVLAADAADQEWLPALLLEFP